MRIEVAICLVAAGLSGVASAQSAASSVQVYGLLDAGVEHINNIGATGASVTRVPSLGGGQFPSRLGFRGSEDLGGGLRAVFTLEAGLGVDSGSLLQGGRAFGRQAFTGLSGRWGTLTMGRQYTSTFYALADADVIGPSIFGLAATDNYLPNARVDNSLAYRWSAEGLTFLATYSFGRDIAPPQNCPGESAGPGCESWSVLAKYDQPNWGAALSYDKANGPGFFFGQPAGTVASAGNTDSRLIVNGYFKIAAAKIGAGVIRRKLQAAPASLDTNLYFVGASYPFTPAVSIDAQVLTMRDDRPSANMRAFVVRGNYALSRRTAIYAMVGHVSNDRNAAYSVTTGEAASVAPLAGRSQTGVMLGMRHMF